MRRTRRQFVVSLAGAWTAVALPRAAAAAGTKSTARKAAILARALSYERSLPERAGSSVGLTVVYNPSSSSSKNEAEAWARAFGSLESVRISGKPLAVSMAPVGAGLDSHLDDTKGDVLVAVDGTQPFLTYLKKITRGRGMLSIGSLRELVEGGLTLGVYDDGDKLKIVVNLKAAGREGARFSSKLLKLADIIR